MSEAKGMGINMQELVYLENGKPVTDSLVVAEAFGKRHADVLRSIDNLESSTEFNERNFALEKREKLSPKNQKHGESGIPQFDLQRNWEWKPNSTFLSEVLDFPAKGTLLRSIGDIGAIEHEQMIKLFKVEQKHVHSMISRGEIIQHELLAERQRYIVYTLGLGGSERIGQPPTRIENWSISDVIEKLVFFEFIRYLENGASSSKFKIKAAPSPFVGSIVYPNEECKVLVLQRPITSFEVPEDDGTIVYALYPNEEYLRPLHGQFGWLQEFPYSTFMPVEIFRRLSLMAISRNDSDPFEFLNYLP
ncbi:Rha family transcriptional regulator [Paenibacillus glucanolyticus]|uniref:Rha family transcriptional regulator n=1 Tax=Paenibacillus glucanolyticus TaxID=59843 RepID=UPI003CFCDEE3